MSRAHAPVWAVVPAAGAGRRVGGRTAKQYLPVAGRALLAHTLDALEHTPRLAALVLVVADGDTHWRRCVPARRDPLTATGGATRMASVRAGLAALAGRAADDDWVLVHDAARPCLPRDDLGRLLAAVDAHPVGGLLARPVADTLKRGAGVPAEVVATVDRDNLWHALTPQVFRHALLRDALARAADAGLEVTDESAAVEHAGHRPLLVTGSAMNIKVTRPEDLALAERLLSGGGILP